MNLSFALYADAGVGVGLGHIFRIYPLFQYIVSLGLDAEMLVPLPRAHLNELGLKGVREILASPESVKDFFCRRCPLCVILDSYRFSNRFIRFLGLHVGSRVVVLDDHYTLKEKVDTVVNIAPGADSSRYQTDLAGAKLIGLKYSPIHASFLMTREKYRCRKHVERVLLAIGGDDSRNNMLQVINRISQEIGSSACIDALGCHLPDSNLHGVRSLGWLNQEELAHGLTNYDLAVLGGGNMLHQFACVGIPVLSWPQTKNQEKHASAWEEIGAVEVIYDLDELRDRYMDLLDFAHRQRLSNAGKNSVDGKGAERIVTQLLS